MDCTLFPPWTFNPRMVFTLLGWVNPGWTFVTFPMTNWFSIHVCAYIYALDGKHELIFSTLAEIKLSMHEGFSGVCVPFTPIRYLYFLYMALSIFVQLWCNFSMFSFIDNQNLMTNLNNCRDLVYKYFYKIVL